MSAGTVYIIQCGEYYKIGRTGNLLQRVNDLQLSNPLPLATFPEVCPWPVAQVLDEDFWPESQP
jgi:hypothetical protein